MLNSKNSVVIASASDYKELKNSFDIIFKELGGEENVLPNNSTVLLKTNLLYAYKPEKAVTTHPLFVEEIARRLIKRNNKVLIGDSPGGRITISSIEKVFQTTGMKYVASKTGAQLVSFDSERYDVSIKNSKKLYKVTVTDILKQIDYLILLPKMKTHALTLLTGAVKLGYGFIPGSLKGELHLRFPHYLDFANMLLDIQHAWKPDLILVDAIHSMEGNGPAGGDIRKTNLVVGGTDVYTIDYTLAKIMGYTDPFSIPFLNEAKKRKLLNENKIKIINRSDDNWIYSDFKKISNPGLFLPYNTSKFLLKHTGSKVIFKMDNCRKCHRCVISCPADALSKGPVIDRKKCISCFCCQESCEYGAIVSGKPLTGKIIDRIWGKS